MAVIDINIGVAAVAGGTVDAITVTLNPAVTPYNLMLVFFRSSGVNTSTTPTVNVNSSGAKTITKKGGESLVAGDIDGDHLIMYDLANTRWELLNPAVSGTITGTDKQVLYFNGNDNPEGTPKFTFQDVGLGEGLKLDKDSPFYIGDFSSDDYYLFVFYNGTRYEVFNHLGELAFNGTIVLSEFASVGSRVVQHDNDGKLQSTSEIPNGITATTQAAGDNSTKLATTEYVDRVNVQTVASSATVTATAANDLVVITAQAEALTLANPSGTWQQGQALVIRIKDNGTSRAIAYGAKFRALGITLPTATAISKTVYLFVIYNSTDDTFDVTGVSLQA